MTPLRDSVKATLLPSSGPNSGRASPRLSLDIGRISKDTKRSSVELPRHEFGRASFDRGRKTGSQTGTGRPSVESLISQPAGEADSFVQSMDRDTAYSPTIHSPTTTTQESASQILNRSDVFLSPTINRLHDSPVTSREDVRQAPDKEAKSTSMDAAAGSQSPSKTLQARTALRHISTQHEVTGLHSVHKGDLQHKTSSPNLQDIMKAGSYPLQRAAGFAGYLKNSSTRMSKLLATESMGYLEKVSGMWTGGRRHYGENEGIMPEDRLVDTEDEEAGSGYGDRFRAHFALPASEKLRATYFAYLHRVLPLYGKIYISDRKFCFRSLLPGTKTKMILPLKDIENVEKEKGFRFGYHGLVLVIRGHEELFFEFNSGEHRDDCTVTLLQNLESIKYLVESGLLAQEDHDQAQVAKAEHEMLQEARQEGHVEHEIKLPGNDPCVSSAEDEAPPVLFDDPRVSIINFTPTKSLNITCLTIGSRGDVQPYIALCKGLLAEGHKPRIATHAEFEPWVRKHGIDFSPVDGDPAELMRICVENGMFTYSFLKEASLKFRSWIDELLSSAWKACQGSDVLIESPSAMAGIHVAEALRIPYFRAFTMPWTRTRAYPHAFAVPEHKIGGAYNYFSYVMFDNVFWKAIAGQVNRWRKNELGLRNTNMDKMQPNKVPFLYNFSPHVVVPPLDYSDWVRVTGYWFLDEASDWTPPTELVDFINKARVDGKKLVYIGFGSIVVSDPAALTKTVVDSVLKADVRCILSKGWSDRLGDPTAVRAEVPLPAELHQIKSAPHDWLFMQIDAAVHHGGAGTTGASLRAGVPTIIKPFFGDQFFFGSRVEDLGVGICLKKVNVSVFSRALWEAVHSERMIIKAKVLGEQIRQVRLY
jgi:sterol 3beta-glucosyltransferase